MSAFNTYLIFNIKLITIIYCILQIYFTTLYKPLYFNRFAYRVSFAALNRRVMVLCLPAGGDVTSPYDVSCDLFDDAPSSQTQSRRSMYLLRSRQKGTTRFTNNSLGGSMCQLRSLSPVTYFSDDEVVVLSGESSDEEEAPSSGESEESLSDICEEEESASAMSETSGADESVSSRLSCPSPIGRSQNSIKVCLNLRYFYRKYTLNYQYNLTIYIYICIYIYTYTYIYIYILYIYIYIYI